MNHAIGCITGIAVTITACKGPVFFECPDDVNYAMPQVLLHYYTMPSNLKAEKA